MGRSQTTLTTGGGLVVQKLFIDVYKVENFNVGGRWSKKAENWPLYYSVLHSIIL